MHMNLYVLIFYYRVKEINLQGCHCVAVMTGLALPTPQYHIHTGSEQNAIHRSIFNASWLTRCQGWGHSSFVKVALAWCIDTS